MMPRISIAITVASMAGVAPAGAMTLDHASLATEGAGGVHRIVIEHGEISPGGLGQPAVRIDRAQNGGWRGGSVGFTLRVSPSRTTFFTIRLWGGETVDGNLTLICGGKEVGDRLLSDYDQLDYGSHSAQFPGAFYYRTYRLPDSVTRGRQTVDCRIDATGSTAPYVDTFAKFQRPMTMPSRGMYDVFTHDEAWLDVTGAADGTIIAAPRRAGAGRIAPGVPGAEVLGKVRQRIEQTVEGLINAKRPLGQHEIAFLGRFRHKTWSPLARDPRVLAAMVRGMDNFAAAYAADPNLVRFEKSTWNPDWFGFGPIGQALASDPAAFAPFLDRRIPWKGSTTTRRAALAEMMLASREWLRTHRRFYTNQSMIVDCWGIYYANRGLEVVAPDKAMSEATARRYLYEAVGIEEWRGDDLPDGGHSYDAGGPDGTKAHPYQVATGYHLVTDKGLTRELGYVGNYGEISDWVAAIYEATRPSFDKPGDPKIYAQLVKMVRARAPFRYPAVDDQGNRAMRMMADIGWRDLKAPGEIAYSEEARTGGGSPVQVAVMTKDPQLVAYAQQMVADNQLWPQLETMVAAPGFRATYGLIDVIDDVAALASMPVQATRLPMSQGQLDFTFADAEDGVIAIKRGNERFYASLWWRGNRGVSNLGRVWMSGPRGNRIATVPVETRFVPGGLAWTRPDKVVLLKSGEVNKGYGLSLAEAGETVPMAIPPAGIKLTPGEDSIYAGRGESYILSYAGYTIAANMSDTKPLPFTVPAHAGAELVSDRTLAVGSRIEVAPHTTVAFFDPQSVIRSAP